MLEASTDPASSRAPLGIGLLCLLSFLVLTTAVMQHYLDGADRAARSLVHQFQHPALLGFMEEASFLGGEAGQVAVVAGGLVLLWPRRRRWAVGLPVVMAGAGAVQLLAKWALDRPRPNLAPWGFPSAHVLSLVVLGGYLAYVSTLGNTRAGRRRLVAGACAAVVGTVAYSRMYLDVHFLSDILGGLTAGFAYLFFAIWAMRFAPLLARALRATPVTSEGANDLLVPVPAGSPAEPLVAAAAVAAMAPVAPPVDPR